MIRYCGLSLSLLPYILTSESASQLRKIRGTLADVHTPDMDSSSVSRLQYVESLSAFIPLSTASSKTLMFSFL
ncbi:uncharacterized protein LAESUDRAFT_377525 [Laetiporus sulphureus 93-53]|uniref:Uncharacterized protein n=1 Tax=Laetiporus sulphureus 93-53 TaxID=1314785 RepID=A0A165CPP3_9APHY|nr:uncharacterized protein LAESUDRAFT_377525 [Laetiporus sulphureus 93-53]KZT03193.1 hypothetical protein LAESUDRAFT_377525 [Laetiporus sulphureus 93-53]